MWLRRVSGADCWECIGKFKEFWGRGVDLGAKPSSWALSEDSWDRGLALFVLREIPNFVGWMALWLTYSVTVILSATDVGSDVKESINFFSQVSSLTVFSCTLALVEIQAALQKANKENLVSCSSLIPGIWGGL